MRVYALLVLVLSTLALSVANALQGIIESHKYYKLLKDGSSSRDVVTLYFAIKGLKQLKEEIPEGVCHDVRSVKYDANNLEHVFYLTNAAALTNCLNILSPDVLKTPTQVLDKKDATIQELYYAVYSLKALGKGSIYDKEDSLKNLVQLLKKDEIPANYGYMFALCEHIGCSEWTMSHADGVLQAADESDSKALHFEGGLPITAMILSSVIRTYKAQKKTSPLTEEQRYKFGQYLLSRRSVTSPRGASLLLEAATALADEDPTPISIRIKGKNHITSDSDSIEFSITDLIGRPVRGLKVEEVVAQSGTRLADDVVVLSKQPLTRKPKDHTTFILNLSKIKSQYGLYKIALSAGSKSTNVNVAVLGEIQVTNVEVGVGDVDGTTSPKVTTLAYPKRLGEKLQADHLQKVSLKFTVRDKWSKPVLVQQAFVRVAGAGNDLEAIFVAEPDNAKAYKVELNVGAIAKHLNHASGTYSLTMYLGDSAVQSPVAWPLGDVAFSFGKDANAVGEPRGRGGAARGRGLGPLPEIAHEFRAAEARPPRLVSDVFAGACAAPLLLLLALWARLRLNLANLPLSLSALLFHLSLGASLSLYGVFWLQLTMFDTVRYLLPLAGLTFLSGHRLLRRLAQDKAHAR